MRLFKRGEIWWVTYGTHPQVRVSTGRKNKKEAEDYALRYVIPSTKEDAAELLERAARLKKAAAGERSLGVKLSSLFSAKDYARRNGTKESSAALAGDYWMRFVAYCGRKRITEVGQLTQKVCADFIASQPSRAAQCATIYCRKILREGGCTESLFPAVPRHRDVTHREPLTPEQIRKMLEYVDDDANGKDGKFGERAREFAWYVRTLLYTGLRMGDAVMLTTDAIDPEAMTLSKTMAKTGRTVEFPIHPALLPYIRQKLEEGYGAPFFPILAASYRKSHATLSRAFDRVVDGIGLHGKDGQYCTHCLRTTFATLCAEHGVPIAVIQSWLGHTSPMVTRIYARIEDMKRKMEALSRLPDFG